MGSYAVAAAEVAAWAKTLVAATVDTVTFARDVEVVRVTNEDGAAAVHFTVDGSTPTVGGAATYRVPAVAHASVEVRVPGYNANTAVKLISSGTPTYSVEGSKNDG